MKWLFSIGFFILSIPLFSDQADEAAQRLYHHLVVGDPQTAIREAEEFLKSYPESKPLHLALLRALCENGNEMEALYVWKKLSKLDEKFYTDRKCLELLAWSSIYKAKSSDQFVIRLNGLIGAAITRDARAVELILEEMRSTSGLIRSIAVSLAAQFGDFPLQDELERLLKEERVWYVRLEVIKAIGKLRIRECREHLKQLVASSKTLIEERAMAILALLEMSDQVTIAEIREFIRSNRAGLRQLGCQMALHFDLKDQIRDLLPLLKDSHPDVRIAALNVLVLFSVKEIEGKPIEQLILPLLKDSSSEVAISAAWALIVLGHPHGEEQLESWLFSREDHLRRIASAAVAASGKRGVALAKRVLKRSEDPYVKANLALGLIGQREDSSEAAEAIYQLFFETNRDQIMWESSSNPLFRYISPSRVRHISQIPNYPVFVDQMTRLDLLSILSIVRYPKAISAVKSFLKRQSWAATEMALSTLIQEGDEDALDLIRGLMQDPDEKLRTQAALIMALMGGDREAIQVLKKAYPHADREIQIHILEAMGRVKDPECLNFLLEVLNTPFQILRVVAASALIQCIMH